MKTPRLFTGKEVTPGCEWVINGEGYATRLWDGEPCRIKDGELFTREDGKWKIANHNRAPYAEALLNIKDVFGEGAANWPDGDYELVGPGYSDNFNKPLLMPHGRDLLAHSVGEPERTYEAIRGFLLNSHLKGIAYHHEDGSVAVVTRSEFSWEEGKEP